MDNESPFTGPPSATVEWCLGLPLRSRRPLTFEETVNLRGQVRRLNTRGYAGGCALPVIFLLPFFLISFFYQNSPAGASISAFILLLLLFPTVWLFLRANDVLRWAKGLQGDLKAGYVKQFEGALKDLDGTNQMEAGLLHYIAYLSYDDRTAAEAGLQRVVLEILPASNRIWKINDEPQRQWRQAVPVAVAAQPEFAAIASKWLQPVAITAEHQIYQGQRELSQEEQSELHRTIARMVRRPLWSALFLNAWIGVPFAVHVATHTPIKMEPLAYFLISFAVFADIALVQVLLMAWRLSRDIVEENVRIVRVPGPRLTPDGSESDSILEFLPNSRRLWTENGKPAVWRRVHD
jgi:hypothetical protein